MSHRIENPDLIIEKTHPKKCPVCQQDFHVTNSSIKRIYCSENCRKKKTKKPKPRKCSFPIYHPKCQFGFSKKVRNENHLSLYCNFGGKCVVL